MKTAPYLHGQLDKRRLTLEDVETALANEVDREVQEDGRTRIWGWVERVGYFVR